MSKSIVELVDNLPADNITVKVLKALDFAVPGKWENFENFDTAISSITGETDPDTIGQIRDKAIELYDNKKNGYQTAVWLYQTLDNTDTAIAAAAMADKLGDTFRFIPFLDKLTPKADAVQKVDLKLKLVAELIAYSKINDLTINPIEFASGLVENYRNEALMRMVALVCIDGLLPLGTNFLTKVKADLDEEEEKALAQNPAYGAISDLIPEEEDKKGLIVKTFSAVENFLSNLTSKVGLTRESLSGKLGSFVEIADDKLDYLAAFLDGATNYFEHTGIQTVARKVITRAYEEIQ